MLREHLHREGLTADVPLLEQEPTESVLNSILV